MSQMTKANTRKRWKWLATCLNQWPAGLGGEFRHLSKAPWRARGGKDCWGRSIEEWSIKGAVWVDFFGSQVEHQIAPATKAHSRRDLSFCFNLFSPSGPPTLIFQLFERSSQNFNVWLCQAREKDSRGEDPKGLPSYDPSAQWEKELRFARHGFFAILWDLKDLVLSTSSFTFIHFFCIFIQSPFKQLYSSEQRSPRRIWESSMCNAAYSLWHLLQLLKKLILGSVAALAASKIFHHDRLCWASPFVCRFLSKFSTEQWGRGKRCRRWQRTWTWKVFLPQLRCSS